MVTITRVTTHDQWLMALSQADYTLTSHSQRNYTEHTSIGLADAGQALTSP